MFPVICLTVCQSAVILAFRFGRIAPVYFNAEMACLAGLVTGLAAWSHSTPFAYIGAVCTAGYAWQWWTSGGGDGTRRQLESWARRFQGTRRTAPSHA